MSLPIVFGGAVQAEEIKDLVDLTKKLQADGKYEEMEKVAARLVTKGEETFGKEHTNTAVFIRFLGDSYQAQGRYTEAEPLLRRSLELLEKQLGASDPATLGSRRQLAWLYHNQGRFKDAEMLLRSSLGVLENELGTHHVRVAPALNELAGLYRAQRRYRDAEPILHRTLEIYQKELGADHPSTTESLFHLALLHREQGRYAEAEPLFRRVLEIREKKLSLDHPDTVRALEGLADLYRGQGRYEETEPLMLRSLQIREKQLGSDHPHITSTLYSLASLYRSQGRFDEAQKLLLRCLNTREKQLGKDHLHLAVFMNSLADLYRTQKQYEETELLMRRSLDIHEKKLGLAHPSTTSSLERLASLYQEQGRYSEAEILIQRGISSSASHWRRTLAYYSERECLEFQRARSPLISSGNQGSGRIAAEAQLLFKGSVIEAMNVRRGAEEQLVQTERGRDLLVQREGLRSQYQQTVLKLGPSSERSRYLQQQMDDFDKVAATMIGSQVTEETLLSTGLVEVQKALSPAACLIETFRYTHRVAPQTVEARYATTLIGPVGEPHFLSHGDARSIEAAIRAYRSLIFGSDTIANQEALRGVEATLYARLLSPLEEYLVRDQIVIFSPDAQLHFIPVGLLRDADGRAFAEKYQVRYISSGRDLVKKISQRKTGDLKAFAVGNPAYRDNAPIMSLAEVEDATLRDTNKISIANNLRSGMGQDSGNIQFRPLPGTAREIGILSSVLHGKGYQITSLMGKDATEESVKRSMEGHDVIHLATHGFFLNELKIPQADESPLTLSGQESNRPQGPLQNPMFRSGLALAGAQSTFNLWKIGNVPPPARDGVLLAAELTGVDLHGTDLVVLSACETASGVSLDGEGVIGLRRAFNAAGATNVIMTLWPVSDSATVEVMEAFYGKYLSGVPAARALAETQRELLPKWVERDGEIKALARLAPFICTSLGPVE